MNWHGCWKWKGTDKLDHARYLRQSLLLLIVMLILMPSVNADAAKVVRNGNRNEKKVAITVDDCYDRTHIASAVALCQQYGVPITFFPIGKALKYADGPLWQSALDAGCEIGNHTWGHNTLTYLSAREIRFQMLRIQEKVDAMLGYHYPMQVMRPPAGKTNSKVLQAIGKAGYSYAVKWDVSQTDFQCIQKEIQNGSILLFHGRQKDLQCLEQLIPWLLEQGYECVTVSELLEMKPVATSTDLFIYGQ